MIHILLPAQYRSRAGVRVAEPERRLMAAVLQAVVDDCRGGSVHRRSAGDGRREARGTRRAIAYAASTDRTWPFSFENLCDALGVNADGVRGQLGCHARSRPVAIGSPVSCGEAGRSKPSAARCGPRLTASDQLRLRVDFPRARSQPRSATIVGPSAATPSARRGLRRGGA